ncbi:MAG: SDR family oxidoreductase [Deltaproteobacteria bacterium]|nr:SDR family oxidoreductase [Deltaproteobacteria bacterium]
MKTIVTGGAGFIGSHLVDQLIAEGHDVVVIDNFSTGRRTNLAHTRQTKIVEADINDHLSIRRWFEGVDWVFHLAALADIVPSIDRPEQYVRNNVNGTFSVLEASRKAKKFIYAASSSCYGIPDLYPTPETAEIRPQYPYALTKFLGEQSVLHWGLVYKLPVISLRFFNVYGPRSRTSGTYGAVFGVFMAQKIHGRPFTVVGDGTQVRDFTYVTDVARAILMAADSPIRQEVFNVASGEVHSVNEIVDLIGGEKVFIPKRPGEPDKTQGDISKISEMLGWQPSVPFAKGVRELLKNIDYWREAPVWTSEAIAQATETWFKYLS